MGKVVATIVICRGDGDGVTGIAVGKGMTDITQASDVVNGTAVAPVNGVIADGIGTGINQGQQTQCVKTTFVNCTGSAQSQNGGDVVNTDAFTARIGMGAVFIHQVDNNAVVAVVGIAVGKVASTVGDLAGAVTPVNRVLRDAVYARVGNGAEVEGIEYPFVDCTRAT